MTSNDITSDNKEQHHPISVGLVAEEDTQNIMVVVGVARDSSTAEKSTEEETLSSDTTESKLPSSPPQLTKEGKKVVSVDQPKNDTDKVVEAVEEALYAEDREYTKTLNFSNKEKSTMMVETTFHDSRPGEIEKESHSAETVTTALICNKQPTDLTAKDSNDRKSYNEDDSTTQGFSEDASVERDNLPKNTSSYQLLVVQQSNEDLSKTATASSATSIESSKVASIHDDNDNDVIQADDDDDQISNITCHKRQSPRLKEQLSLKSVTNKQRIRFTRKEETTEKIVKYHQQRKSPRLLNANIRVKLDEGQQNTILDTRNLNDDYKWTKCENLIHPRSRFGSAVVNGKIYVFGGIKTYRLNTVEIYNPTTNRWTEGSPMLNPRNGCVCTNVGNKIYLIGGKEGGVKQATKTCGIYNTDTNRWLNMASMALSREYHAVVSAEDMIYAIGGFRCRGRVEAYDTKSGIWSELKEMSQERYGFCAVVVGKKIYAIGGKVEYKALDATCTLKQTEYSGYLNTMEVFDIEKNEWTLSKEKMANRRFGCTAFVCDKKIVVLGGCDENSFVQAVEMFDLETNQWSASLMAPPSKWERKFFSVHLSGRDLYVIGGSDSLNSSNGIDVTEKYRNIVDLLQKQSQVNNDIPHLNTNTNCIYSQASTRRNVDAELQTNLSHKMSSRANERRLKRSRSKAYTLNAREKRRKVNNIKEPHRSPNSICKERRVKPGNAVAKKFGNKMVKGIVESCEPKGFCTLKYENNKSEITTHLEAYKAKMLYQNTKCNPTSATRKRPKKLQHGFQIAKKNGKSLMKGRLDKYNASTRKWLVQLENGKTDIMSSAEGREARKMYLENKTGLNSTVFIYSSTTEQTQSSAPGGLLAMSDNKRTKIESAEKKIHGDIQTGSLVSREKKAVENLEQMELQWLGSIQSGDYLERIEKMEKLINKRM